MFLKKWTEKHDTEFILIFRSFIFSHQSKWNTYFPSFSFRKFNFWKRKFLFDEFFISMFVDFTCIFSFPFVNKPCHGRFFCTIQIKIVKDFKIHRLLFTRAEQLVLYPCYRRVSRNRETPRFCCRTIDATRASFNFFRFQVTGCGCLAHTQYKRSCLRQPLWRPCAF